jgi:hypothetical protein
MEPYVVPVVTRIWLPYRENRGEWKYQRPAEMTGLFHLMPRHRVRQAGEPCW